MECFSLFFRYRRLIWSLVFMDFKVRYAGSQLGLLWTLLSPLFVLGLRGVLGLTLLLLPLLVILQALFTIGVVWFLSCVNIVYRDTSQVIGLLIVPLMFLSPIAYTQEMVPGGLELVVKLNPLSYLIDGYRGALMFNRLPSVAGLVTFASLAFVTLLTGYRHFMRLRRELPDFV